MFNNLKLIILIIIGLYTCYTDIEYGLIKNKLIFTGFLLTLSLYFIEIFSPNKLYISDILINFICATILTFFIWIFHFWAAGDAKLFILFSFLVPLKYYSNQGPISFFPSFILLVNIFILVLIYLIINICFKIIGTLIFYLRNIKETRKELLSKYLNIKERFKQNKIKFLKVTWGYLCIFLLIGLLKNELAKLISFVPVLTNFSYLILFFLYRPLSMFFKKTKKILWIPTALLFCYIIFCFFESREVIFLELVSLFKYFFGFMGLIFIFRTVLRYYVEKKEVRQIEVRDLQPRMQLAEKTIKSLKSKDMGKFYPDGLTREQVEEIQQIWPTINPSESKIEIYRTFPLAPFIFLGALVTILIKGSLLKIFSF